MGHTSQYLFRVCQLLCLIVVYTTVPSPPLLTPDTGAALVVDNIQGTKQEQDRVVLIYHNNDLNSSLLFQDIVFFQQDFVGFSDLTGPKFLVYGLEWP